MIGAKALERRRNAAAEINADREVASDATAFDQLSKPPL